MTVGGKAVLKDSILEGNKISGATVVGTGSTAMARACVLEGNGTNVLVDVGGAVDLTGCSIKDARVYGMTICGAGSKATATDCQFNDSGFMNISATTGGEVNLLDCTLRGTRKGWSVLVSDAVVCARGCSFLDNSAGRADVSVKDGGRLAAEGCKFSRKPDVRSRGVTELFTCFFADDAGAGPAPVN